MRRKTWRYVGSVVLACMCTAAAVASVAKVAPWSPGRLHVIVGDVTEGLFDSSGHEVARWTITPGRSEPVLLEVPAGDYVLVSTIGPPHCLPGLRVHVDAGRDAYMPFAPISPHALSAADRCYPPP